MTTAKTTEAPIVIETFNPPNNKFSIDNMELSKPHVMNGVVSFRKYRVTIELIDEPHDVLAARLQGLYDASRDSKRQYNSHHWEPLQKAAESIGVELKR